MPAVTNCVFPLKQKTAICDREGYKYSGIREFALRVKPSARLTGQRASKLALLSVLSV